MAGPQEIASSGHVQPEQSECTSLIKSVSDAKGESEDRRAPCQSAIVQEGLSKHQELIITVISVVAVLVANVSFLGYVTPPGGSHPYWEDCRYPVYVAFLICNGLAFLFSLGAVGIVVATPWLYAVAEMRTHTKAINRWLFSGMLLLFLAIALFTVAFVYAGLVTGDYAGAPFNCNVLPCEAGGSPCLPDPNGDTMSAVLRLNKVYGQCFVVQSIASGNALLKDLQARHKEPSVNLTFADFKTYTPSGYSEYNNVRMHGDVCYMTVRAVGTSALSSGGTPTQRFTDTQKILCTTGADPLGNFNKGNNSDAPFWDVLALSSNPPVVFLSPKTEIGTIIWVKEVNNPHNAFSDCSAEIDGCLCSESMLNHESDSMFVSFKNVNLPSQIYLAAAVLDSTAQYSEAQKFLGGAGISEAFGQNLAIFSPPLFESSIVVVHDELQHRCSSMYNPERPTVCAFGSQAWGFSARYYSPSPGGAMVRQCGAYYGDDVSCSDDSFAINTDGKYIQISQLGEYGSDILYDQEKLSDLGQQTGKLAFIILGIAFFQYLIIVVCLLLVRFKVLTCCVRGPSDQAQEDGMYAKSTGTG